MSTRFAPAALLALVGSIAAVGCGGGGGAPEVAAVPSSDAAGRTSPARTSTASEDPQKALLRFARCMREHGVEIPDPTPVAAGGGFVEGGELVDVRPEQLERAQKACEGILPQAPPLTPEQQRRSTEDSLAFARCMREQGIEMPDPSVTADGVVMQPLPDGVDPSGPRFQKAAVACQAGVGGTFFAAPGPG